jgi:hypothetical protein
MPEKISSDTPYLRLESINPAENRFRYYVVTGPLPTLWGTFGLLCEWGRLDQQPRGWRVVEASDEEAAQEALARGASTNPALSNLHLQLDQGRIPRFALLSNPASASIQVRSCHSRGWLQEYRNTQIGVVA